MITSNFIFYFAGMDVGLFIAIILRKILEEE